MRRGKNIIIGGRTDSISDAYIGKFIDSLKEYHASFEFVDFRKQEVARWSRRLRSERQKSAAGVLRILAEGKVDIGVLDARSIPIRMQSGIELAAVPRRGNPFDALVSKDDLILDDHPESACLAANEPVRIGQLLYYRPDLVLVESSGNFEELFQLLSLDKIQGFVSAASDIEALNHQDKVSEVFTTSICTPIAGQGAIGLLVREDDRDACQAARALHDSASGMEIGMERMFLSLIAKDGKGPIGVLVNVEGEEFKIEGTIAAPDGSEKVTGSSSGRLGSEMKVVEQLARDLLSSGGERILEGSRNSHEGRQ